MSVVGPIAAKKLQGRECSEVILLQQIALSFDQVAHAGEHQPFAEREVMEWGPGSVWLEAREFHHLGPLLRFVSDVSAEIGRRACQQNATHVGKAPLHYRIDKTRIDQFVESVDILSERVLRCADAEPRTRLVARYKFCHGWDLRQRLRPCRGSDRQPTWSEVPMPADP